MRGAGTGTGYIRGHWPVLLLMAAVLLPTACVLWLMNDAIGNQRLLVRQRLGEAYHTQLSLIRDRLDSEWAVKAAALDEGDVGGLAFLKIVKPGLADSAVILDAAGVPVYPSPLRAPSADPTATQPEWVRARRLEETDLAAAATAYQALAQSAGDPGLAARAWQAAARCLVQSGHGEVAAELAVSHLAGRAVEHATDLQGRLIPADALLMALHFLKPASPRFLGAARRLRELLLDYGNPAMSSGQRVFLMKEMGSMKLPPGLADFPTLAAEELAAQSIDAEPKPRADRLLRSSALAGVWKMGSMKGRVVALFRTATVQAQTQTILSRQALPSGVRVQAAPPDAPISTGAMIQMMTGERLPGWQLVLIGSGSDPFEDLAARQMTLYFWIGSLVIGAVVLLALLAVRIIRRSLRVAGMKADLVAAVSHELKTPLTSMQLLVDTLLEDPVMDPVKTREYLEMMARENSRLSLLIANFLAFSRMERNKYKFEFASVRVVEVVDAAVHAAGERFQEPGCELNVEVAPGLSNIHADESALVTALVNLLDNAYKYTPEEKRITLRAFAANGAVCFEVRDNGIGIAPREMKRIFLKFYQADRRLSRSGGGCGLGLSIVRFLVEAHGGSVKVASEPGKGSTFTVALGAV
jgi:signal transduction histidine kinase